MVDDFRHSRPPKRRPAPQTSLSEVGELGRVCSPFSHQQVRSGLDRVESPKESITALTSVLLPFAPTP
jgi:hypothetical protein